MATNQNSNKESGADTTKKASASTKKTGTRTSTTRTAPAKPASTRTASSRPVTEKRGPGRPAGSTTKTAASSKTATTRTAASGRTTTATKTATAARTTAAGKTTAKTSAADTKTSTRTAGTTRSTSTAKTIASSSTASTTKTSDSTISKEPKVESTYTAPSFYSASSLFDDEPSSGKTSLYDSNDTIEKENQTSYSSSQVPDDLIYSSPEDKKEPEYEDEDKKSSKKWPIILTVVGVILLLGLGGFLIAGRSNGKNKEEKNPVNTRLEVNDRERGSLVREQAQNYIFAGEYDQAISLLTSYLEDNPDDAEAQQLLEQARNRKALAESPETDILSVYKSYIAAADYSGAVRFIENADEDELVKQGLDKNALLNKARTLENARNLMNRNDYDGAEELLEKYLAENKPSDPDVVNLLDQVRRLQAVVNPSSDYEVSQMPSDRDRNAGQTTNQNLVEGNDGNTAAGTNTGTVNGQSDVPAFVGMNTPQTNRSTLLAGTGNNATNNGGNNSTGNNTANNVGNNSTGNNTGNNTSGNGGSTSSGNTVSNNAGTNTTGNNTANNGGNNTTGNNSAVNNTVNNAGNNSGRNNTSGTAGNSSAGNSSAGNSNPNNTRTNTAGNSTANSGGDNTASNTRSNTGVNTAAGNTGNTNNNNAANENSPTSKLAQMALQNGYTGAANKGNVGADGTSTSPEILVRRYGKRAITRAEALDVGQDYIDDGKYDEAINLMKELLTLNPQDEKARELLERAQDLKRKNGGNDGKRSTDQNLDLAKRWLDNENYDDAIAMLKSILEKDPDNV